MKLRFLLVLLPLYSIVSWAQLTQPATPKTPLEHFQAGEAFLSQNNYQSAANQFRESLKGNPIEPKWVAVWVHVDLGKIFDLTGQRQRAIREYKRALDTKDNTRGALDEAAKYVETPFSRK